MTGDTTDSERSWWHESERQLVERALAAAGLGDVTVKVMWDSMYLGRGSGKASYTAVLLHRQYDLAVHVPYGAKRGGGYKASLYLLPTDPLDSVVSRVLAANPNAFDPPTSLDEDVRELLPRCLVALKGGADRLGERPIQAVDSAGMRAFRWTPLAADESKKKLRAAFEAACEVAAQLAGSAGVTLKHRRGLRAMRWPVGDRWLVLWETDHDPGAGLLVHAGWFTTAIVSPPW